MSLKSICILFSSNQKTDNFKTRTYKTNRSISCTVQAADGTVEFRLITHVLVLSQMKINKNLSSIPEHTRFVYVPINLFGTHRTETIKFSIFSVSLCRSLQN